MNSALAKLDALIDEYLAGKQRWEVFWRSFMDTYGDARLSAEDEARYEEAYDAVYMGSAGRVPAEERSVGVLDEDEVKERLRAFRVGGRGARPA